MKVFYCKKLNEDINFDIEYVYTCCGQRIGPDFRLPNKTKMSLDEYCKELAAWKYRLIKKTFFNEIPKECKGCEELKSRDVSLFSYLANKYFFKQQEVKIKNIIIKSFRHCDLACIYCIQKRDTKGKKTTAIQKSEFYDVLPIIKALKNNNLLDEKELNVEFQGGSIQIWDEFVPVLNEIVKYGVNSLIYHTNAISYIPEIAQNANIFSTVSVSIDSGCAETYEKIKSENKFYTVVENIIRYANAGIKCIIKYIIIKNINDNIDEISKFLETVYGIRERVNNPQNIYIMISLDYRAVLKSNYSTSDNHINLIMLVKDFCIKNNICLEADCFVNKIIS